MFQRKCDSCMMSVNYCPALEKYINPELFATREELCEINHEEKKNKSGFTLVELLVIVVILFLISSVCIGSCSPLFFQKNYSGTVIENQALGSGQGGFFISKDAKEIAFSRAVNIRTIEGEDIVFSTTDRQFFVVKLGDCVMIKVFQYPPWMFSKAGSYYNGRLLKKWQCKSEQ